MMKLFPENWKLEAANTLCSSIIDCINKTAPVVDYDTPFKMIRTTNVKNGRINLDDARCVDEATFIKWNRRLTPQKDDIVLTREAPLGDVGLIRTDDKVFLGQRTMLYRANPDILDQRFLYYTLLGPTLQAQLKTLGSGSTVEHVRVPDAEKLTIPYPCLATQRKIAAILSAYDDLIENNNRRITLLENMAEEIYREWFVRFRFPGYKTVKFEKGIPDEWEIKRIGDVVDRKTFGKIYKEHELFDDGEVIVMDQSRNDFLGFYNGTPEHKASPKKPIIIFGDHTCKMVIMLRDFSLAENVIPFSSKNNMSIYFLFFSIKNKATQTEYKRHWTELITQEILIAPKELQDLFTDSISDNFRLIESIKDQIRNLNKAKKLLLPRLISGKLSVEDINIQHPSS